MPKRTDIHKIMVIGSGPIIIGQAAEFDYSGTQACLALREEGYEVVLVNSNPATIMTDTTIADKVYIEPLTVESISRIIRQEYPDAILPTLGGQVGLNMAMELAKTGILDELHIELLGTKLQSIEQAEDREKFKELCKSLGEPVPPSKTVNTVEDALAFGDEIGYPIIVRPAFTMGGTGGGICNNHEELAEIAKKDAQFALELKKLATFEEFISLYYGDVLAREIKDVFAQDYEATQLHYQNALNLQKSGQIARIEVLSSQVASDKSKNKLHQAQNASISANIALQTALDNKNITPSSKLILSQKPLQDEEYYVQKTLANYPALQSMDLKIESATQATKIARGAFLPQVVGMGSYIVTDKQDSLLIQAMPRWYVGVGVSMPILTSNARIQKYQASKLAQLELESLKAQATKDLTLLVRRTYKEAVYAREEYKNLYSSIQLAEENLKLQQNAFKQGMATSTQVIDAQNMLQSEKKKKKTIAYKAIVALAKLLVLSDEIETFYEYQQ